MVSLGGRLFAEAEVTEVKVLPEVVAAVLETPLGTSLPALDRALGGIPFGQPTLIDSASPFLHHIVNLLCLRNVLDKGSEVVFIDGGNSIDPHGMVSLAKRFGARREEVLPMVNVARAFTAHQMAALVLDRMEDVLESTQATLLVLAHLPELFWDEEIDRLEGHQMLSDCLHQVLAVTRRRKIATVGTNLGLAHLHRRPDLRRLLYSSFHKKVRIKIDRNALQIQRSDAGEVFSYLPVPPNQMTLADFPQERLPLRPRAGAPRSMPRI